MKKHRRLLIVLGGFIIIALIASYFSFKSYTNIGVNDNSEVTTSNNQSAKKHNKKQANNSPKTNDNSIFLQSSDNPDRIIAINPYGSKGIYQYRQQANGDIYPEYKYFNGSYKKSKSSINVSPLMNNKRKTSLVFKNTGSNKYKDTKSNENFTELNKIGKDKVQIPLNTNDGDSVENQIAKRPASKKYLTSVKNTDTPISFYARVGQHVSDPSQYKFDKNVQPYGSYYHLSDGSFIVIPYRRYVGHNFQSFDVEKYNNSDPLRHEDSINDAMYYRQNNVTTVSQKDVDIVTDWNKMVNDKNTEATLF